MHAYVCVCVCVCLSVSVCVCVVTMTCDPLSIVLLLLFDQRDKMTVPCPVCCHILMNLFQQYPSFLITFSHAQNNCSGVPCGYSDQLLAHQYRLGLSPPDECPWGTGAQTPEHLLSLTVFLFFFPLEG